jgi:uncharacterized membrane protein
MDNKLRESIDIGLERKLCSLGLLGTMVGSFILFLFIGGIISLGGAVAYIIGIFNFSKKLNNGDIFKNFIISFIVIIIGVILFTVLSAGSIASIFMGGNSFREKAGSWVMDFVSLFVLWLSIVLFGFFSKKYLDIFYEYTKDDLFKHVGLGVLIGGILFGILLLLDE